MINGASRRPARGQVGLAGRGGRETLELLPCGCVTAVRRAHPWPLKTVSVEAKGPYCVTEEHRSGAMLRILPPPDWLSEEDEEDDE